MIVRTRIFNEASKEFEIVHALLDSAANQSFMASALADRMQLDYHSETTITVTKFGGRAAKKRVKRVTANLFNANGEKMAMEFYTQERIIPPLHLNELSPADKRALNEIFPEVEEIVDRQNITPELLIGIDYFNYVMQLDVPSIRLPSGIFVTSTFFGPVISGLPRHCMEDPENVRLCERVLHAYVTQAQLDFTQDYSDLWKLPNVGIDELGTNEEENDRIVKEFYDSVELKDGKIYVCFPWKSNKKDLVDNYNLAASRLHQLFRMKDRNPKCWNKYCNIIEEQLRKQFIEDANGEPAGENPCYYIPHQAVIKAESETTKTRIVLDASSKRKGELSLNDVIYQGPLILPNLCGILLRSRLGKKVMTADIEKAFHMIHLQESERDSVRFLWLKDVSSPPTPDNVRILRFCRLPFGINASPFLLRISIKYGIGTQKEFEEEIYEELNRNLYVDDVLMTDTSTASLFHKYRACKKIFSNISMNLRQFMTSDPICNQMIDSKDLTNGKNIKTLGIQWNPVQDELQIRCTLQYDEEPTKRKVLQAVHSTFDPLGYLTSLLLPATIFLQDLWNLKYSWDDPLSTKDSSTWRTICENAAGYVATFARSIAACSEHDRYELYLRRRVNTLLCSSGLFKINR
ncbi:hypothetical protein Y032_0507g2695 [Ancylostoma ceylanicum]|uniref:Peptidase aspartic putative domain-containing protein n=1 Tax=Ancylostoma ceylanicum TaxID=53326 RepID=A0A016WVH2_9BILA|nr:hypothetical protein Y032_0507g2695 [Ancylostoma ceylanicum]